MSSADDWIFAHLEPDPRNMPLPADTIAVGFDQAGNRIGFMTMRRWLELTWPKDREYLFRNVGEPVLELSELNIGGPALPGKQRYQ